MTASNLEEKVRLVEHVWNKILNKHITWQDLSSSGKLRSVYWKFFTDVSGQSSVPSPRDP